MRITLSYCSKEALWIQYRCSKILSAKERIIKLLWAKFYLCTCEIFFIGLKVSFLIFMRNGLLELHLQQLIEVLFEISSVFWCDVSSFTILTLSLRKTQPSASLKGHYLKMTTVYHYLHIKCFPVESEIWQNNMQAVFLLL